MTAPSGAGTASPSLPDLPRSVTLPAHRRGPAGHGRVTTSPVPLPSDAVVAHHHPVRDDGLPRERTGDRPRRPRRRPGRRVALTAAAALALAALPVTGLVPDLPWGALDGAVAGPADGAPPPAPVRDPFVDAVDPADRPLLVLDASGGRPLRQGDALPARVVGDAVVVLHGYTSNAAQIAERLEVPALVERLGAVAVLPTGLGHRPSWDAGTCCGSAARSDVDDVGFVAGLLDELRARGARHAYVVGYSNGGMLAYRLACERPEEVDAVAVVNATIAVDRCDGAFTALHLAGAEDRAVPVGGVDLVPYLFTGFPALADLPALAPAADLDLRVVPGAGHEVPAGAPATVREWLATHPGPPTTDRAAVPVVAGGAAVG